MSAPTHTLSADYAARFFNEAAEMLLVLSGTLHCMTAPPAFYAFTNQTLDLISGTPVGDLIHADDRQALTKALRALGDGEQTIRFNVRTLTAGAEDRHTDWSLRRSGDAIYCGVKDASEWLWRESLRIAHQDILTDIVNRVDLNQILAAVCRHM